ncbi:MAG: hypothetical protein ACYC35_25930 [Pirellulales bacterium]
MKTKTFDCVEMKRRAALRIYEETKDMTLEQKIDYWRHRSDEFRREQSGLRPGVDLDRTADLLDLMDEPDTND